MVKHIRVQPEIEGQKQTWISQTASSGTIVISPRIILVPF